MTEPQWLVDGRKDGRVVERGINRGVLGNVASVATFAQHVDIPPPPSTNKLTFNRSHGKGRGRVKSDAYREWIALVEPMVMALKPLAPGPFRITYTLVGGSDLNLGRDLGNLEKPLSDLLVSAKRISNDSLWAGLHELILRFVENDSGSAYVRIETASL